MHYWWEWSIFSITYELSDLRYIGLNGSNNGGIRIVMRKSFRYHTQSFHMLGKFKLANLIFNWSALEQKNKHQGSVWRFRRLMIQNYSCLETTLVFKSRFEFYSWGKASKSNCWQYSKWILFFFQCGCKGFDFMIRAKLHNPISNTPWY